MKRVGLIAALLLCLAPPLLADVTVKPDGRFVFTGGTVTTPILFGDGTEAAPSMAFSGASGTGFWRPGASIIGVNSVAGSTRFAFFSGVFNVSSSGSMGFSSTTNPEVNTADVWFEREGAANFQMGADVNGAAVDQTFSCADAITGANISGGDCTFQSGSGMGTGTVSSLIFQTPTVAAAGANAQSPATRLTISSAGLTATVPAILPAGSCAAPNLASVSDVTDGLYVASNATLACISGVETGRFAATGFWSGVASTSVLPITAKTLASFGTPTVSACGTTPSAVTGTNIAGHLTTGSGGTVQSCTITFVPAYTTAPSCIGNNETAIILLRATATTTTLVIDSAVAGTMESDAITYICLGGS